VSYTIFFDSETGGIQPHHPTIQLAAVVIDDSDWSEKASFECKIRFDEATADPEALKINHYTVEAWKDAIPASACAARFSKFCEPYRSIQMISKRTNNPYSVGKLAGHNAIAFDLPRLRQMFGDFFFPFSYHVKDTLQRALWFYDEHPEVKRPDSLKLSVLCESFGICIDGAHDALADVTDVGGTGKSVYGGRKEMIVHQVDARSAAWFYLRLGKPTASEFHKIVTPTGKLSTQAAGYAHGLLAELMLGHPLDSPETQWMVRGQELEDEAISAYEFTQGVETQPGGFITNDQATYGCSPDRMVGTEGILEMKCPAPNTHVGYLMSREIESEKRPQVQGQMLVTGCKWVDLMSYHPEMPPVVVRIKRDESYIALLKSSLDSFVAQLQAMRLKLEQLYGPFRPIEIPQPEEPIGDFDVTDADVAAMINCRIVIPETM